VLWSATTSRLAVLAAAVLFSTGGVAIKGTSLSAFQVAGLRSGVAALALLLLLPESRRGFGRDLLPAAFAYAGTLTCFVVATKLTTSAAAIFLQSTAPIWVLLLAPFLVAEPIRVRDLPFVGAAAAGLLLVFLGSREGGITAPNPFVGNLAALACGRDRSLPATVLGNVFAVVLCAPFAFPMAPIVGRDLASILYLGVIQIGLAYWMFSRALRRLPTLEVSLLILLEPVLNPLWTWLFLGERPSALASLGGAIMVCALAAKALFDRATACRLGDSAWDVRPFRAGTLSQEPPCRVEACGRSSRSSSGSFSRRFTTSCSDFSAG
jgi:drug/metabolite transporter, DME family